MNRKRQPSQKILYTLPKPPPENINTNGPEIGITPIEQDENWSVTAGVVLGESSIQAVNAPTPAEQHGSSLSQFLCAPSVHEETVLEKILKHLEEIKNEIRILKKENKKLRETIELKLRVEESPQVSAAIGGIMDTESFANLPLDSVNELQDLEKEIISDTSKATLLARFLCRGGGFNNMNSLILLVMKRLLKRHVAMQYSFEGKQQKKKFSDLNLLNVVVASIKMKFEDAEVAAINSRIGKVLAGSSDWDGNRVRGKRKQMEAED